jgi:hypothetical protein
MPSAAPAMGSGDGPGGCRMRRSVTESCDSGCSATLIWDTGCGRAAGVVPPRDVGVARTTVSGRPGDLHTRPASAAGPTGAHQPCCAGVLADPNRADKQTGPFGLPPPMDPVEILARVWLRVRLRVTSCHARARRRSPHCLCLSGSTARAHATADHGRRSPHRRRDADLCGVVCQLAAWQPRTL